MFLIVGVSISQRTCMLISQTVSHSEIHTKAVCDLSVGRLARREFFTVLLITQLSLETPADRVPPVCVVCHSSVTDWEAHAEEHIRVTFTGGSTCLLKNQGTHNSQGKKAVKFSCLWPDCDETSRR